MAKCPYCNKSVTLEKGNGSTSVQREVRGIIKKEIMYSCPHCDCVLGFGYYIGGLLTGNP